jgi:hypothetical protein
MNRKYMLKKLNFILTLLLTLFINNAWSNADFIPPVPCHKLSTLKPNTTATESHEINLTNYNINLIAINNSNKKNIK